MLFYLKRPFATLNPSIFLPLYKAFICPYLEYAIQTSSPILTLDRQAIESAQKLSLKFVKGLRHVPYETDLQRLQLFSLVGGRIRGDLISTYKIMHALLDFSCDAVFAASPALGFEVILSRITNSGVRRFIDTKVYLRQHFLVVVGKREMAYVNS